MEGVVRVLFSSGLAPSTQRSYQSGTKRYLEFCRLAALDPFPVQESSLCLFVAHLSTARVAGPTVKLYLAAVRHAQITMGMGDPRIAAMPQLEYVTKGYKKTIVTPGRTRLPVTMEIMRKLHEQWEQHPSRAVATMLWAAACMCFFGFLRTGEIVVPDDASFDSSIHLATGDVKVDDVRDPQFLEVQIKASKTDPFRLGVSIYIGRTGTDICPVAAILAYAVQRGTTPSPFFRFSGTQALTRARLVKAVREALSAAGVEAHQYSGHSFRIGTATTAAAKGVPDSLIKTMGRWKSMAYTTYIRTPRAQLCAVSKTLCS